MFSDGTSKKALQNSVSTHFMLATFAVRSITSPSSWWNIGECVASESWR